MQMVPTNKKKSIAAAVLGWVLCSAALAEPGVNANEIVLGQAAGFTGSVAGTVKELTAGAKAYFDRVNATGGVHGRKIVLESLDDGFDPKRTPDVVRQLIDEKQVFALFLSRGTPTNEAAYPLLEEAKVPLIGPSTGAMSMYDPPRRYLFPVRPSYHSETAKIVGQLVSTGINRIAVFHTDDSFGKDGLTGTLNAMHPSALWLGLGTVAAINLWTLHRHRASLGKMALKLRIVRRDGSEVELWRIVALRWLPTAVIGFVPGLNLLNLIDALFIFREDRRCVHDMVADTVVVDA